MKTIERTNPQQSNRLSKPTNGKQGSDLGQLCKAPLRMKLTTPVLESPERALEVITELDGIVRYLNGIKAAEIEFGADGQPRTRYCTVAGMGQVKEEIVWFDEEYGYAYSADAPGLPMKDHLGVALVTPGENSGAIVTWDSYFNWKGVFKPLVMKLMFPRMMKELGRGLQSDLGANGRIKTQWMH